MKKVYCANCGVELEVVKKAVNWNCPCCRKMTIGNEILPVYEGCYTHPKEQSQPEQQKAGTDKKITATYTGKEVSISYPENQRVIVTRFDGTQYVLKLVEVKKRVSAYEFQCLMELGNVVDSTHIYEIENQGYIQAHCIPLDIFCP